VSLYIVCIFVWHPDGHRSDQNVLVNNNMVKHIFSMCSC